MTGVVFAPAAAADAQRELWLHVASARPSNSRATVTAIAVETTAIETLRLEEENTIDRPAVKARVWKWVGVRRYRVVLSFDWPTVLCTHCHGRHVMSFERGRDTRVLEKYVSKPGHPLTENHDI